MVHTVRGCAKFPWQLAYYSATLKLTEISVYQNYTACETPSAGFEVRNNIATTFPASLCSRRSVNFKG